MSKLISKIKRLLQDRGWDIIKSGPDFSDSDRKLIQTVRSYTMTSPERLHSLIEATRYVIRNDIPGSFVECGVWRGGSVMAMASVLMQEKTTDRDIFLYDTFSGMTSPSEKDVAIDGTLAAEILQREKPEDETSTWCKVDISKVKDAVLSTGYPEERVRFVAGPVEATIPDTVPGSIALLRLDTDFYESTKHELVHLYPLLAERGVIIVDDYGQWQGQQQAVDEYFRDQKVCILLNRIDYTGRIGVKTSVSETSDSNG